MSSAASRLFSFIQPQQLKKRHYSLLLIFAGLLAYANAVNHPYVHDDIVFIADNPEIRQWNITEIFFGKEVFVRDAVFPGDGALLNSYYRPVLDIIYRAGYWIFQGNPHGFHFLNIVIHICNSLLVFQITHLISQSFFKAPGSGVSFAVAALFLLHPVQTESVACIVGISNLVYAAFFLLSFLHLLMVDQTPARGKIFHYALSCLFFALALLSKEQAAVLPFIMGVYFISLWVAKKDRRELARAKLLIGHGVILLFYFIWRKEVIGSAVGSVSIFNAELPLRLAAIPQSILIYLKILALPYDLHYYRNVDILQPQLGLSILILIILAIGIFMVVRNFPDVKGIISFGTGFFLVALMPTLNIIPLINEYSLAFAAEHFLYLSVFGILLSVVPAIHYSRIPQRVSKIFFFIAIFFSLMITVVQNTYWRGEIPLFERMVRFEKSFGRGHLLLAWAYFKADKLEEAKDAFQAALGIMQGYYAKAASQEHKNFYGHYLVEIHSGLARCSAIKNEHQSAIREYLSALNIAPHEADVHNNLGVEYIKVNDLENAAVHFKRAYEIRPANHNFAQNLMNAYWAAGLTQEAGKIKDNLQKQGQ